MYLPPRTPRLRVCQSQNHSPNPLKSGRSSCCLASLRLVPGADRPKSAFLLKNSNVNLPAKMPMSTSRSHQTPMSIPSPKCTTHEHLTPSQSRCPRAGLTQNCPTLGIRPLYFLEFDSHSALPISARNTSIEPYLARLAIHRQNLS